MDEKSMTVVIVDDDESVRKALKRLLQSNGYQVVTFESAEDLLDSESITDNVCFLLDIRLPGISGLALYKHITASGTQVPVVLMTAHDLPPPREEDDELQGLACIRKPFGEHSLLDALRAACRLAGRGADSAKESSHVPGY